MKQQETILALSDVRLAGLGYDTELEGVSLTLRQGEVAVVTTTSLRRLPLADAAEGLVEPEQGTLQFLGRPWSDRSPDESAADRARIGRTFHGTAWVSNLDVDENITLKLRHHSSRPWKDIQAEAVELAIRFGFPDLPRKRPAWVPREELVRAQWIRALLGDSALLLLEYPEQFAADEHLACLKEAVRRKTEGGTAALWISADPRVRDDRALKVDAKYRIMGTRWSDREETDE